MRKIYIIICFDVLLLGLIPFASKMAVYKHSPIYTHFIYMFAHANIIHWAVNAWCILVMNNLFTNKRLLVSYIFAIVLSFLYQPKLPVLGMSIIISFFIGFMTFWLYKKHRLVFWQTLILMSIGFFIPNIAALYHLFAFLFGVIYNRIEYLIADIKEV